MGSRREAIAIGAFNRRQNVHFMTTLAIINAIINVGNGIISAVSGGGSSSGNEDAFKKTIDAFKDLMFPTDVTAKEARDKKILDKLTAAAAEGPIKFRPGSRTSKDRGRIRRGRRSDINGSKLP